MREAPDIMSSASDDAPSALTLLPRRSSEMTSSRVWRATQSLRIPWSPRQASEKESAGWSGMLSSSCGMTDR